VREKHTVYCAVRAEFLDKIQASFRPYMVKPVIYFQFYALITVKWQFLKLCYFPDESTLCFPTATNITFRVICRDK